jgi:hypothetical protein
MKEAGTLEARMQVIKAVGDLGLPVEGLDLWGVETEDDPRLHRDGTNAGCGTGGDLVATWARGAQLCEECSWEDPEVSAGRSSPRARLLTSELALALTRVQDLANANPADLVSARSGLTALQAWSAEGALLQVLLGDLEELRAQVSTALGGELLEWLARELAREEGQDWDPQDWVVVSAKLRGAAHGTLEGEALEELLKHGAASRAGGRKLAAAPGPVARAVEERLGDLKITLVRTGRCLSLSELEDLSQLHDPAGSSPYDTLEGAFEVFEAL